MLANVDTISEEAAKNHKGGASHLELPGPFH
jgi:hypothetical protein